MGHAQWGESLVLKVVRRRDLGVLPVVYREHTVEAHEDLRPAIKSLPTPTLLYYASHSNVVSRERAVRFCRSGGA